MSRILFQSAGPGYCSTTGDLVRKLQGALKDLGYNPGTLDGEFAGLTQTAVTRWQIDSKQTATGKVDEATWTGVTWQPIPSLKERSLQLTAAYEGTGFTKVVGNFDDAGITWGIIGFTLKYDELAGIFRQIQAIGPDLITDAFGDEAKKLFEVFALPWDQQLAWADSISLGKSRYYVAPDWADAFATFGSNEIVQKVQLDRVENQYWDIVRSDLTQLRANSPLAYNLELSIVLLFDIAVQDGGIGPSRIALFRRRLELSPTTLEREARQMLAQVVAHTAKKSSYQDVLSRKQTIATGDGVVHGSRYLLSNWAVGDYPINPGENF